MNAARTSPRQALAWLFALLAVPHIIVVTQPSTAAAGALFLLATGRLLSAIRSPSGAKAARILILAATVTFVAPALLRAPLPELVSGCASILAAALLLWPLTPGRARGIGFCILILMTCIAANPETPVHPVMSALSVLLVFLLTAQAHRPVEAGESILASILRALGVALPVGMVVTLLFWVFPQIPVPAAQSFAGFAGDGMMNPGAISALKTTHRPAFKARFTGAPPATDDLYWRGEALEVNNGLAWSRAARTDRPRPTAEALAESGERIAYEQFMTPVRGCPLPLLERAVTVEARRDDQDVAVISTSGGGWMPVGVGPLQLKVTSTLAGTSDPPLETVSGGCLAVPREVSAIPELAAFVPTAANARPETPAAITRVSEYLSGAGFTYSREPGSSENLGAFLAKSRRGFCEHYAALAATLLRLSGIPARVVSGYRGGEWNPWTGTVIVREEDAHAWVEAWDTDAQAWLRYDPTDSVTPTVAEKVARSFDPSRWTWHERIAAMAAALVDTFQRGLDSAAKLLASSATRIGLQTLLMACIILALAYRLLRAMHSRTVAGQDTARRLLGQLERGAIRHGLKRECGEPPLSWIHRLLQTAPNDGTEALTRFASAYESLVYSRDPNPSSEAELKHATRQAARAWRHWGKPN